jgi:ribose transport system substrate-binding protein
VKGKTYWYIELAASIPADTLGGQGLQAAAAAAGARVQIYDGKGAPATIIQGVNTAIAAKADGIVLFAIDMSTLTDQLKAAKAAGIPVIETGSGSITEPFLPGVTAHVTADNTTAGKLQADYALYATQCKLNAMIVSTLSVASSKAIVGANQAEIKRLCPTDCKVTDVDVNAADIATKLPGLVESALQRNPDTNMIIHASDSAYVPGIQVAQNALGTKLPLIGYSGNAIPPKPDVPIVADTVAGSSVINGWFYFDAAIRAANGQTAVTTEIPTSLVDKTTWGTGKPPWVSPAFNDYQNTFKQLWGIS